MSSNATLPAEHVHGARGCCRLAPTMTHLPQTAIFVVGLAVTVWACGSPPPPKAEPTAVPTTSAMAVAPAAPTVTPTVTPAPATEPASGTATTATTPQTQTNDQQNSVAANGAEPTPEPKFLPIDVMTGREMSYLIDYANSGALEVAKKSCAGKTEEDATKHAECLAKAREKFGGDVIRFKKDAKGKVKLVTYRRSNSALVETFTAAVELKEISPHLVKVEVKGGSSGQRPVMRDRGNFEVKVPNGYSLELDDSTYGRLPYEAKVGLVAN